MEETAELGHQYHGEGQGRDPNGSMRIHSGMMAATIIPGKAGLTQGLKQHRPGKRQPHQQGTMNHSEVGPEGLPQVKNADNRGTHGRNLRCFLFRRERTHSDQRAMVALEDKCKLHHSLRPMPSIGTPTFGLTFHYPGVFSSLNGLRTGP